MRGGQKALELTDAGKDTLIITEWTIKCSGIEELPGAANRGDCGSGLKPRQFGAIPQPLGAAFSNRRMILKPRNRFQYRVILKSGNKEDGFCG